MDDSVNRASMTRIHFAHSHDVLPVEQWHYLEDHLNAVAEGASKSASMFGSSSWGRVLGLWHDLGKYQDSFQTMLRQAHGFDAHLPKPGRIDHSTVGAAHVARVAGQLGRLVAYCIAGHHAGLPDGIGGEGSLTERLNKASQDLPEGVPEHLRILPDPLTLPLTSADSSTQSAFRVAFFCRMLFSTLVDADYRDTARFMQPDQYQECDVYQQDIATLNDMLDAHISRLRSASTASNVQQQRDDVLNACLDAASHQPGFFSLTVPTGGGKTLASLSFALRHAHEHGLRRVIYAIPFTSIIEQNAAVFIEALGQNAVLEHHSAVDADVDSPFSRLTAESWDAPIVVTTNVQLFESLFASRPSRCRKIHNIARSVIVLDEVQALPTGLLLPCLAALRELVECYECTIVLCTATMPAIEARAEFPEGIRNVHPIIKDPEGLYARMRRTRVTQIGPCNDAELCIRLKDEPQVLCVVNTRRHARSIAERLREHCEVYHLSASMCAMHRTKVLDEIRARLNDGLPCRVISTQLIEAGVDVDFPVVYRALAGLDAIAQAAGRCNRNGRLNGLGNVIVFEPQESIPVGDLRLGADISRGLIQNPAFEHEDDLIALARLRRYFERHIWLQGAVLDRKQILPRFKNGMQGLQFPFRSVADDFVFIPDSGHAIIIPYDDRCRDLVQQLRCATLPPRGMHRRLQRYIVTVRSREQRVLRESGAVEVLHDNFTVLCRDDAYDANYGLLPDGGMQWDPESFIV